MSPFLCVDVEQCEFVSFYVDVFLANITYSMDGWLEKMTGRRREETEMSWKTEKAEEHEGVGEKENIKNVC